VLSFCSLGVCRSFESFIGDARLALAVGGVAGRSRAAFARISSGRPAVGTSLRSLKVKGIDCEGGLI
jgi:hypothetical protein